MWVITYKIAHKSLTAVHTEVSELTKRVEWLKSNRLINNIQVFRIGEEVDINAAYPDYFGGDDSGQCP